MNKSLFNLVLLKTSIDRVDTRGKLDFWSSSCVFACVPALRVVHEEQVEQPVSGVGQPGEFILQVVVRLLPQAVLPDERQLGEALNKATFHEERTV